uniref:Uncharacterized protein n=1 Tax=Oryza barthii TaxID=65489 RepID=A0A0D3HUM9_9ORYZ
MSHFICPTVPYEIPVEIAGGGDYGSPRALLIRPPVVVDGVAYSLGGHPSLVFNPQDQRPLPYDYFIFRVDVSFHRDGETETGSAASPATITRLPTELRLLPSCTGEADVTPGQLLLVPSSGGGGGDRKSLALLVGRRTQVEIWAMNFGGGGASARSASRLLSVSCTKVVDLTTTGVHRSPCSPPPMPESDVVFVWSGEASGAVVLRLGGTLCLLDRRTMVVRALGEDLSEFRDGPNGVFLPYEQGVSSWVPSISP